MAASQDEGGEMTFSKLLRQLQAQHDQEVGRLKAEIATLRAAAATGAGAPKEVPKPAEHDPVEAPDSAGPDGGRETAVVPAAQGPSEERAAEKPSSSPMQMHVSASSGALSAYMKGGPAKHEPQHWRQRLTDFITGPFELLIGACIVINIAITFVYLELRGRAAGADIGLATGTVREETLDTLEALSIFFTLFFACELLVKIALIGITLFKKKGKLQWFNIFDAAIVLLSIFDTVVLSQLDSKSNLSVLRGLRIIRVLRMLHIARTLPIFGPLRVLVSAVFASFFALFWSMILLGIVMLTGGLFLSHAVHDVVTDVNMDMETREWAYEYYGTASRACWSVFELTFSGGWPNYARRLVEKVSPVYAVIFALYISTVVFGMFRIITALFLKETVRVASLDIDNTIQEKLSEKIHYAKRLAEFFQAADASGDGTLTREEFNQVMQNDHIKAYLATLELNPQRVGDLFNLIDDGDHSMTIDEFCAGAMRLKGGARSQDLEHLLSVCTKMSDKMDGFNEDLVKLRKDIDANSLCQYYA